MPVWDVPDIDEFYPDDDSDLEEEDIFWDEDDDLDLIGKDDEFTEEEMRILGIEPED